MPLKLYSFAFSSFPASLVPSPSISWVIFCFKHEMFIFVLLFFVNARKEKCEHRPLLFADLLEEIHCDLCCRAWDCCDLSLHTGGFYHSCRWYSMYLKGGGVGGERILWIRTQFVLLKDIVGCQTFICLILLHNLFPATLLFLLPLCDMTAMMGLEQ